MNDCTPQTGALTTVVSRTLQQYMADIIYWALPKLKNRASEKYNLKDAGKSHSTN